MTIVRDAVHELASLDLRPAVSIMMPTHHAGPEVRQDPIRFKNMLRQIEGELEGRGL
jgi:hypothetical protein